MGIKFSFWKNQTGQSLIELLVAIGLAMVILPGLLTGFVASREGKAQEGQRLQGYALMKEMEEAVKSVREKGWSNIATNNTYYPTTNGTVWSLAAGAENIAGTDFTRQLVISSVNRDNSGNIVGVGGIEDPSSKRVNYTVSWTLPNPGSITSSEYLQRYLGNTNLSQTTQTDFDSGIKTNTTSTNTGGGTIQLTPGVSSFTYTDDYLTPGNYTYDGAKIEVLSSFAQLKNSGGGGSQTTNSGFDTNATGWTFALYGQNLNQAGSWIASGGNLGGYIQINFPSNKNKISGGYYYQAFSTISSNPTATLTFNWRVTAYPATADSFHLYAWIDSASTGTPVTQVWDSGNITATSAWSGTVTVNVSPQVASPGTRYLKVGSNLNYNNGQNRGPYTLGYDNVLLSWTGAPNYASDSPAIYPTSSFQPANVTAWTSFSAVEVPNGGLIRYQLSADNGAIWQYWNGSAWATATLPTNYNTAAALNTNIPTFSAASGQIKVKAFLIGNGTEQVKLDSITIGYNGSGGANSGTFISSTMDSGGSSAFNRLVWTDTNTANTTTKLQVAINSDNTTWNYFGTDGTGSTYFTNNAGIIPLANILGRYFRYKIFFDSTNSDIPTVSDVSVNYSP